MLATIYRISNFLRIKGDPKYIFVLPIFNYLSDAQELVKTVYKLRSILYSM